MSPQKISDEVKRASECGILAYKQQEYEKAIEFFDTALTRDPKNEDALKWKTTSLRLLRRFDEAEKAADGALKVLPDSVVLLNERGFVEFDRRNYEKAIEFFEAALTRDPKNEDALQWKTTSLRALLRFDEAEKAADGALKVLPDSVVLLNERGFVEFDRRNYEKAIEFFDTALTHDPKNEDALQSKTASLRALRRFDEAEKAADGALKVLPDSVVLLNERGFVEFDRRNYEKAIEFFEAALIRDPKNEDALKSKTTSLRALQRFDEAEKAADGALKVLPDSVVLLNERGFVEFDRRNYEKAIEFLDTALIRDPKNEDALKSKTTSLRALQRFDEAEKAADGALKVLPDSVVLLNERGFVEGNRRNYEKAIEFFDTALTHDPKNEDALQSKTTSLRALRRFDEAEKAADGALKVLPDSVVLLNERGFVEFDRRNYEKAIKFFEAALTHDPKNEDALSWKASSLGAQQKTNEAIKFLEEWLQQLPKSSALRVRLGWLYLDQDALDCAERVFSEAATIAPDDSAPLLGQAEILTRQNRSGEAVGLLRSRLETFPKDFDVRNTLGWIYNQRNDPLSAQKEFEAILKEDSKNVAALNGLGAVYFTQEDYEKAADQSREAAALQPYEPIFLGNLGLVFSSAAPR